MIGCYLVMYLTANSVKSLPRCCYNKYESLHLITLVYSFYISPELCCKDIWLWLTIIFAYFETGQYCYYKVFFFSFSYRLHEKFNEEEKAASFYSKYVEQMENMGVSHGVTRMTTTPSLSLKVN